LPTNVSYCGTYHYVNLDFNGTNLALYLDEALNPIFSYPLSISKFFPLGSSVYIGWTLGTGGSKIDVVLSNITLQTNSLSTVNKFYYIKESCSSVPYYVDASSASMVMSTSTSSFNNQVLLLNPNNQKNLATYASFNHLIDLTMNWELDFNIKFLNCTPQQSTLCFGSGFTLGIQNEGDHFNYVGQADSSLGYIDTQDPRNSMAILFDSLGFCLNKYQYIRFINDNMRAPNDSLVQSSVPATWKTIDTSKCNIIYPVKISYMNSQLSVSLSNQIWFTTSVKFSDVIILQDNRYGILEYLMATSTSSSFTLQISNFTLSAYTPLCTQKVLPLTSVPYNYPEINCISGDCSVIIIDGSNILISSGSLVLISSLLDNKNLTITSASIIFASDLSLTNTQIQLNDQQIFIDGTLTLINNTIDWNSDHPISATGCIILNNTQIILSVPGKGGSQEVVLFNASCIIGNPDLVLKGDRSECWSAQDVVTSSTCYVTFRFVCQDNTYIILIGSLIGVTALLLIIGYFYVKAKQKKRDVIMDMMDQPVQ